MRKIVRLLAPMLLLAAAFWTGQLVGGSYKDWEARAPERAVASLPGVGDGWLDTLRRVAGPAAVDTINAAEVAFYGPTLLGLHAPFHNVVSVQIHIVDYMIFIRAGTCASGWFGYLHPLTVSTPWGVAAHEFGHRYAVGTPDAGSERFADRFSRAMVAIRGWDEPDARDVRLHHHLRYLLMKSYWRED